jgi:hypothetical protein
LHLGDTFAGDGNIFDEKGLLAMQHRLRCAQASILEPCAGGFVVGPPDLGRPLPQDLLDEGDIAVDLLCAAINVDEQDRIDVGRVGSRC